MPAISATNLQSDFDKKVSTGITMLKTGKEKQFLELFLHPEEIQKRNIIIDKKFVDGFKKGSDFILSIMKEVSGLKPEVSTDKLKSYQLKNGQDFHFSFYQGQWYILSK